MSQHEKRDDILSIMQDLMQAYINSSNAQDEETKKLSYELFIELTKIREKYKQIAEKK